MGFLDANDPPFLLDTQTDRYSPGNDIFTDRIREIIEWIYKLSFGTGVTGTATEDPPNDISGLFVDSSQSFPDDEHNNRTLILKSGAGIAYKYHITDVYSGTTLVCSGQNLYSDGIRSGDEYEIFYDIKNNLDGHDHDGENSPEATLAKGRVMLYTQAEEDWTEYSNNSETYVTKETIPIYVPSGASNLFAMTHTKGNGVANANVKFTINSLDSNVAETSQANSYEWNEIYRSVSGFSPGLYEVEIKIATTTAGNNAYLNGFMLYWGP